MITAHEVMSIVEGFYKLPEGSIREYNRTKTMTKARKCAMLLARKYTEQSWAEIGDAFHRTHDTVLRGCRKVNVPPALEVEIRQRSSSHLLIQTS